MSAEATGRVLFKTVIPQFTVLDVVRTAVYYRDVLGFQIIGYWDGARTSLRADPPPVFGIVSRDEVGVFFSRADRQATPGTRATGSYDAYSDVSGIEALAAELRDRGAELLHGPEDRVYPRRELVVRDCNGLCPGVRGRHRRARYRMTRDSAAMIARPRRVSGRPARRPLRRVPFGRRPGPATRDGGSSSTPERS